MTLIFIQNYPTIHQIAPHRISTALQLSFQEILTLNSRHKFVSPDHLFWIPGPTEPTEPTLDSQPLIKIQPSLYFQPESPPVQWKE